MQPEDQFLYLSTRQKLTAAHTAALIALSRAHDLQWQTIYAIAEEQGVAPLIHTHLASPQLGQALPIPQNVRDAFKTKYMRNVFVNRQMGAAMREALQLLQEKSIDVMIVKGEALNYLVYERPWYMETGDIDLVVRNRPDEIDPQILDKVLLIFLKFNLRNTRFKRHIEVDYVLHHDFTMNGILPIDGARVWREATKVRLHEHEVFVMSPEDMLLAAVINSCRKRFFKLKSLCDIAEIIRKYPQLDWDKFATRARDYHCNNIALTALLLTDLTLGCELPENALNALQVHPVRSRVIRQLVGLLYRLSSLSRMAVRTKRTFWQRELSWSLLLTYATYSWRQVPAKIISIYRASKMQKTPLSTLLYEKGER
ncbi:MAG: hypothetical protein EXR62_05305 [Chloroflexi bacterium]|nr:hypothetical protein [Chloroflexota bacterium]